MTEPVTVPAIMARKGGRPIVALTAYDAPTGALLDRADVDLVLVGDSLGNVVLGHDSTLPVTMSDMLHHLRAVRRGVARALLVADMPFGSYQPSAATAVRNAAKLVKAGAAAVKLEGGSEIAETVRALRAAGIPVMGHVGLTPQRIREYGGYRTQGRRAAAAADIIAGARVVEAAGAFCVVLEAIPAPLAQRITARLACPTIGIGAGPACDGQILVFNDLVGLTASPPAFARKYADGLGLFARAVRRYAREVRTRKFPSRGAGAAMAPEEIRELDRRLEGLGDKG